ncbi:MAG TPA: hypothetical protein VN706_10715 [Gemmatimonadaceae bacterium]|nr:hypothetical protein [Gemmatimonadaceae bacterium]
MLNTRKLMAFAAIAALGAGCARYTQAGGDVIDPAAEAKTVVLEVNNINTQPMELRTVHNGESHFIGSVGGNDSTSILLDPSLFPTGSLFVAAIPADARGRALVGPLTATKGDKIRFTVQPTLGLSHAIVIH